ncbi:MAG: DNA-binding response regulator [Planctomycetaceae bacterium]|nr:DNA-binding response regulator [Planctomycetaceae bacterium]
MVVQESDEFCSLYEWKAEKGIVNVKTFDVVVADRQEVVRIGWTSFLRGTPFHVVGWAASGAALLDFVCKYQPQVVLMDAVLDDGDSLRLVEKIHAQREEAHVIILSASDNPTYVARAHAWGASDFLSKSISRKQLLSAVTEVVLGLGPTSLGLMRDISRELSRKRDHDKSGGLALTPRESQVLRHLGYGLNNREIGRSLEISVETVKEHVQNLLRKLHLTDRTQAAVWAVKKGIV